MSLTLERPKMRAAAALLIDGSDVTGLGGLQGAASGCAAVGVHAAQVVTRVEAPGAGWFIPWGVVEAQLRAAWTAVGPDAVLSGGYGEVAALEAACGVLEALPQAPPLVVNPRLFGRQGRPVGPEALWPVTRRRLIPLARAVMVNIFEAEALVGRRAAGAGGARDALKALVEAGAGVALLHSAPDSRHAVDLVFDGLDFYEFGGDRLERPALGAGAALAGAVVGGLARGAGALEAIEAARALVQEAVAAEVRAGALGGGAVALARLYGASQVRYDCLLEEPPPDLRARP
jgi:hydroxymethylpyrimidine/phosphomethylpyrimidine kinase